MKRLEWIPILIRSIKQDANARQGLSEYLAHAKSELSELQRTRQLLHDSWTRFPLLRRELLTVKQAIKASDLQLSHLQKALKHLQLYHISGLLKELNKTLLSWEASERYYDQYYQARLKVDLLIEGRMARAA